MPLELRELLVHPEHLVLEDHLERQDQLVPSVLLDQQVAQEPREPQVLKVPLDNLEIMVSQAPQGLRDLRDNRAAVAL